MRFSQLFVQTLRDIPSDAEVASHQLLARAGYIIKLASGIYSYTPLMLRVINNINAIIRDEMNKAGAQELLMPILQPAELWEESGRWSKYGDELFRLKDRHERPMALGPTHEEIITSLARANLRSYKQLPVNLYQIQNKYRDERRPRFGLLRGREFIMKDGYSFHANEADMQREYAVMAEAYTRIFKRCGLDTVMVESDNGAIGGAISHEFMVLTGTQEGAQQSGENDVVYCEENGERVYAANIEKATALPTPLQVNGKDYDGWKPEFYDLMQKGEPALVDTPGTDSIESLSAYLVCKPYHICKTLIYVASYQPAKADEPAPERYIAVLIRGDYDVEETKLKNHLNCAELRMASEAELQEHFGSKKGFIGFYDALCEQLTFSQQPATHFQLTCFSTEPGSYLSSSASEFQCDYLIDNSLLTLRNFIIANNLTDKHIINANWKYNLFLTNDNSKDVNVCDLRKVKPGDIHEASNLPLQLTRGIEVGNIFQLGTTYSAKMKALFTDEGGRPQPCVMGTYGIGVTRIAAAAVERHHDANGILWPPSLAPFPVVIILANPKDSTHAQLAETLYQQLQAAGLDPLLDDRAERAGVKFNDADLLGLPLRLTVGKKANDGLVEVKRRIDPEATDLPVSDDLPRQLKRLLADWPL